MIQLGITHKPEGAPEDRVDQFRMNTLRRTYCAVIEKELEWHHDSELNQSD